MNAAVDRCLRALPPTLVALRPAHGAVALRCYRAGCAACSDFAVNDRAAYEAALGMTVIPFDCGDPQKRDLARYAGVRDLPAYVVVPAHGPVTVRTALWS